MVESNFSVQHELEAEQLLILLVLASNSDLNLDV